MTTNELDIILAAHKAEREERKERQKERRENLPTAIAIAILSLIMWG